MGSLEYDGWQWIGSKADADGVFCVCMSDATFRQHLNVYLQSVGVPTETYFELLQHAERVSEQHYKAIQQLCDLEYWRDTDDPNVRIFQYPPKKIEVKSES